MRIPTTPIALALLAAEPALADAPTASFQVSATVMSTCTIAVDSLGFGAYDPLAGGQVDGSATVSVACTKGAAAAITLSQGANATQGSTDAQPLRRMSSGDAYLSYGLYTDPGRTTAWGNTPSTGKAYVASSSAPNQLTVYGRIAAHQDVAAGTFNDVIVATIAF